MASSSMIFLLLLSSAFSLALNAHNIKQSTISLGSSLSTTTGNTSWLSPSGQFAFGFYPQGGGFAIGIWFDKIPEKTVVWSYLNGNDESQVLQVPRNATLLFNNEGWFILRDHSQGQQDMNILNSGGERAASASMLDSGNFVLYNSTSGPGITWQSFDSPTNTILQGQQLSNGAELFSSASNTDHSTGRFRLKMQNDGNLVQYPIKTPDTATYAYYASGTNGQASIKLKLEDNGHLYLINGTGLKVKVLTDGWNNSTNGTKLFYRMTLDIDGIFRVYSRSLDRNNGNWSIRWASTDDKCAPKGLCGLNGFCTLMDQEPDCRCLPGFDFIDQSKKTMDCVRNSSVECRNNKGKDMNFTMFTLDSTWWEEDTYSSFLSITEEECKDDCLDDCNCEAVRFDGRECRKQKLPLRYGRRQYDVQTKTFIKNNAQIDMNSNTNQYDQRKGETNKESKKKNSVLVIIGAILLSCSILILVTSGIVIYKNHANYSAYRQMLPPLGLPGEISLKSFTYNELEKATDGFKEELGRGGFGIVFKGTLPTCIPGDHQRIAVKRLDQKLLDEGREGEFLTELRVIGRTYHRNLVKLLGYCSSDSNRLLVYEFMSRGSLADYLFNSKERPSWDERLRIVLNVARGILYLHEECETQIIHCDIKLQNILMDEWGCAKISDFELAKLLKPDQTKTFTGIRGTRGYVAPEWHRNLPVTVKADVYSLGIVLLEIVCCRRNLDVSRSENEVVLADWAYDCFEGGQLGELVGDEEAVDERQLDRMVRVAIWCIQDEPSLRPCIKKVVLMLEGTVDIPIPPSPSSYLSSI